MAHGAGHGHGTETGEKKWVAVVISVLALCLAIAETFAKGAQTTYIATNVEASNLWAFFQARTIRQTSLNTAAQQMEVDAQLAKDPATKELLDKRVGEWKATVARWESEPKTGKKGENVGEGRRELMARALEAEKKRDLYLEKYHHYEISSAAFQIAIVLASVYLLTSLAISIIGAGIGGAVGVAFLIIGSFFPHLVHL